MTKKKTAQKARVSKVEKPYNSGTWSTAQFWGYIRSKLRQASRWWKPIQETKIEARRKYVGENKRMKWEYKCAICEQYFPEKEISIDHIKPVGQLRSAEDLAAFVTNLFCTKENLQCICKKDHDEKTKKDTEERKNKQ